ncbi:hypothetical protein [Orientia tsutsugamushi]|uniref:hypothetical protein n=1 Tax=Orientia tsutsugamushi TaxID=784 RepID=UPI0007E2E6FF|nr:hypothetical protein [Orientia tsutsugamushi]
MSSGQDVGVFINRFELHLNHKKVKSSTNEEVVKYYNDVSKSRKMFQVFCTAKSIRTLFIFGSSAKDVIVLDQKRMFIKGGGNSDIYLLLNDDMSKISTIDIDNFDEDKILDILKLPSIHDVLINTNFNNDLKIIFSNIGFTISVLNWKNSNSWRHLIFMDQENDYYIPCYRCYGNQDIVQFYMVSKNQKEFEVRQNGLAVVFTKSRNVKFYKMKDSLVLAIGNEGSNELILTIKNFYLDTSQWENLKIYFYKDGDIDDNDPIDVFAESSSIEDYSYGSIVEKYDVDLHSGSKTELIIIQHNHNGNKDKIGVLVLKNVMPNTILATQEDQNLVLTHTISGSKVIIEKYFTDIKYAIDVIEFSYTIEPIRIYLCNSSIERIYSTLKASVYLTLGHIFLPKHQENIIKCIVSLHSLKSEKKTIDYETLGFISEDDQILFTNACVEDNNFPLEFDLKLYFEKYQTVLLHQIKLKCYNDTQIKKHNEAIDHLRFEDIASTASKYLGIKNDMRVKLSREKRSDTSFKTIDSYESDIADNESDEYDDDYNEQQDQLEQVYSSASRTESFIGTWIGNSINTVTHYLKESVSWFGSSASKLNSDDTMSMVSKGLSYDFVDTDSTDNTNISVFSETFNLSTLLLIQHLGQYLGFFSKNDTVSHHYLSEEQYRQVELNNTAREIIDGLKRSYKLYNDDDYQSENSENVEEDYFVEEEVNYEHDLYW